MRIGMPDEPQAATPEQPESRHSPVPPGEPKPFMREHFERYLSAQWVKKGETFGPDSRLGISIADLIQSSVERNSKLDAPYLDLWIAILDELNSWLVSLMSSVYAPTKQRDTKMNDFERSIVVLGGKLIADTTALRHLITLGYDSSARALLRSTNEYVNVLVALIDDPALASEFVTAETPETANAFYYRQLARGKLHRRIEAAWAEFFKSSDDAAKWFANQQRWQGSVLSGTSHPSFAGGTQALTGFIEAEPDETWLGHWGAKSNMSVLTISLYADCIFPLLLLSDFPFEGFDDALAHPVEYDPSDEMHRHVRLGRSVLASMVLSLSKESNIPHIFPPGFEPGPAIDEDSAGTTGAPELVSSVSDEEQAP